MSDIDDKQKEKKEKRAGAIGCLVLAVVAIGGVAMCSQDSEPIAANSPDSQAAVKEYYQNMITTMGPCENASKKAAEQFTAVAEGQGNEMEAYSAISEYQNICGNVKRDVAMIDAPSKITDDISEALENAGGQCFASMEARFEGMGTMLQMLDGDVKPSVVNKLKQNGDKVQSATTLCVSNMMQAAQKAGVAVDQMK